MLTSPRNVHKDIRKKKGRVIVGTYFEVNLQKIQFFACKFLTNIGILITELSDSDKFTALHYPHLYTENLGYYKVPEESDLFLRFSYSMFLFNQTCT